MTLKGKWIWLYLEIVALTGAAAIGWLTPRGAGVDADATVYIRSAQSLLAGSGYALEGKPLSHFPPLYPALLALAALPTSDLIQAARLLDAVLFGFNLALIAFLAHRASGRRLLVSILATLFAATSEPFLGLHTWTSPAPLFVALALLSVLFMVRYAERARLADLVASAISMGLALITQYAAVGLLPGGVIILYLARPRRERRIGLRDAGIWLGAALLPLVIFLVWNLLATGRLLDRSLAVHPTALGDFVWAIANTSSSYIALEPSTARLGAAIILLISIYVILPFGAWTIPLRESDRRSAEFAIPFSAMILAAGYFACLYLSLAFLDASTPVNARILAPAMALLIASGFPAVRTLAERFERRFAWTGFALGMILVMLLRLPGFINAAAQIRNDGLGYTSRQWTDSPTIAYIKTLPSSATIYSNGPEAVLFLTARTAIALPLTFDPAIGRPNSTYASELDELCRDVGGGGAYLVYFEAIQVRGIPGLEALQSACSLPLLTQVADGVVLGEP